MPSAPSPRAPRPLAARLDSEPRWRLALVLLFALAAAWRWAYLARLRHTAFADSLDADARIYWDWSESILRHGLLPPSPFYLAPLYPYALAGWRLIGGGSIAHVLAVQALLGAAAVALLTDATARLAGRPAALAIGAMLALFQATTFFEALVLPESLLFFVESLLVWTVARADWSRASVGWYAAYGLLVGVLAQGRATAALLLALVLPLAWSAGPARRLGAVAAAGATFAACCLPAALANLRTSGELIPFTYNLGYNLYVGNNPGADGAYVDVTGGSMPVPLEGTPSTTGGALDGRAYLLASEGLRLSPAQSSAYWTRKALAFVRAAPLRALALACRKLLLAWNAREIPQIETMRSFARAAGPLGLPLVGSFGFLAILGLPGVAWAARRGAHGRWLGGYLTVVSLAMVPFFVTDRYRLHLVPALAVLAGISIAEIHHAVRGGAEGARVRTLLAIGVVAAVVLAPIGPRQGRSDEWGITADHAVRLLERGAYADAADAFARAEASLGQAAAAPLPMSARTDLAAFYFRYGIALEALGRHAEAIARWERAASFDPNDAASLGRLSVAYERAGRTADAARMRQRLAAIPGGRGQTLVADGWTAAGRGDLAAAEQLFLEALQAAPNLSVAWEGLIRVRIQAERFDDASRALDQARGAGLDPLPAGIYEAFLASRRGDLAAARGALDRLPAASAPVDPVLVGLLDEARRRLGARRGE